MRMVVRHLGSLVACLAGVLCVAERALAADAQTQLPANAAGATLLRWAPPSLENPTTIDLSASSTLPRLDSTRDYILKMPAEPRTKATMIVGGRNVVVMGGHIALANLDGRKVADAEKRAIYIKDNRGTVHIEGVLIDGSTSGEFDAVAIAAPESIVQLQNIRALDVHGTYKTFHGDVVQPWGGVKELRIDRMTASTHYQGLQIDQDLDSIGREIIQNVNLSGPGNYKIWLTKFPDRTPERIELSQVYVTLAKDRPLDRSVWPDRNDRDFGAQLSEDGKSVSWPNLPFVTGEVLLGPPPEGDFVPEGAAGAAYKSPGYQTRK